MSLLKYIINALSFYNLNQRKYSNTLRIYLRFVRTVNKKVVYVYQLFTDLYVEFF